MNSKNLEFEPFETALSELLQGGEMPTPDFASRVMAQVAQTPQEEKKTSRKVHRRYIATIAACAAVVVLCAPFLRMMFGMGAMPADKAADAATAEVAMDTAAPDGEASGSDDSITEYNNKTTTESAPAPREGEVTESAMTTGKDRGEELHGLNDGASAVTLPTVILEADVFDEASRWLLEQGYPYEDGYTLTADDVALLNAQFPDLELDEVDCILQGAQ